MNTLFVSDLHIDAKQPEISRQFLRFLQDDAPAAEQLFVLGDLFESWVGDDDPQPEKEAVAAALKKLSDSGIRCYFMRGNRDFLVGEDFAESAGLSLLDDEALIETPDGPVLLMHGDSLCTDDYDYQAFRTMVRSEQWQQQFLALPLAQRLAMAAEARQQSMARNATADEAIMDVNQDAVEAAMRRHGVTVLLHGHTHRPDIHHFNLDGTPARRIVLGDWYDQGSIVSWDDRGPRLQSLPRPTA